MVRITGFFDVLRSLPQYGDDDQSVERLNRRHGFLVEAFRTEIEGARVLDLAAHDGRWSYAFAAAGAAEVIGIEARAEPVARFADYPETEFKPRVSLRQGDIFAALDRLAAAGARFDVVAALGILYHVMDHFRLLQLIRRLSPKLVIVDGEFALRDGPVVQLVRERTDNPMNATPQVEGQEMAVVGLPSMAALEMMAEAIGYRCDWSDWGRLPQDDRAGVQDYFRTERRRRATCALRPR